MMRTSVRANQTATSGKAAFFKAIRKQDVAGAWTAFHAHDKADKFMLSALVGLVSKRPHKRAHHLATLWASVTSEAGGTELDAHLSSDFISGFGAEGNVRMARRVLDARYEPLCARRKRDSGGRAKNVCHPLAPGKGYLKSVTVARTPAS